MPAPTVQAVGTPNSGTTGAVTYTLPAHQSGDILILVTETNVTAGLTAPSGWVDFPNSPLPISTNVSCVNAFWLRATSSSETNPQVAATTNHQVGLALVVRGAIASGNPYDITPTGSGASSATTFSVPGGTTTVNDCRVFTFVSDNLDTASDQFTSVANSSLASFTEHDQFFVIDGNGGGIGVWSGTLATAGVVGSTTGTITTSSSWSGIQVAIKPAVAVAGVPIIVMPPRRP